MKMDKQAWHAAVHGVAVGHNWAIELNWTDEELHENIIFVLGTWNSKLLI